MKLSNCKLIAVIIVIIIVFSIFFVNSNNYDLNDSTLLNYNPYFENGIEEIMVNQENNFQFFKWSKNIFFSLNMEYILFSILSYFDLFNLRHTQFIKAIFIFYSYSTFIVFFLNKKDGKKHKYVYS